MAILPGALSGGAAHEGFSSFLRETCAPYPPEAHSPLLCMGMATAFGCQDQGNGPYLPQFSPPLL